MTSPRFVRRTGRGRRQRRRRSWSHLPRRTRSWSRTRRLCGCAPTRWAHPPIFRWSWYAEDLRINGSGVLRYSYIFSNEDGGTATPALLARWGRTTDIEMAYEEEWKDGRVAGARFQAPDHHVLDYAGPHQADHPSLLDATLNNVFLDRGRSAVRITIVPVLVDLEAATRESVMDKNPWVYHRMADELNEEGKTAVYGDVREYLYVDAKLTLTDGAVAALARGADGTWRASDRGIKDLAVDRNGWVRIAIPQSRTATDVGFVCYPTKPATGHCRVEISRVLSLDDGYKPTADKGRGDARSRRPARCDRSRSNKRQRYSSVMNG